MYAARAGRPPYGTPHQQMYATAAANQQFPHGMTNPSAAAAAQAMAAARYPSPSPYNQRPQSLMLDGQEGSAAVDMYHSPVPTPQMPAAAMYRRPPGYYATSQGSPAQSPHGQVHV